MQDKNLVYDLCWKLHKLWHKSMKIPFGDKIHEQIRSIPNQIISELETFPEQKNQFLHPDIIGLFNWGPLDTNIYSETKKPFSKITKKDVQIIADKHVFRNPEDYEFYFKFGFSYDFRTGYRLGTGIFYSLDRLPEQPRKFILSHIPYERAKDHFPRMSKKDWLKIRRRDAYMKITIKSIGEYKAREKAFSEVKRNYNIFKIVDGIRDDTEDKSPFYYYMYATKQKRGLLNESNDFEFHIVKSKFHDKQIKKINKIFIKKNPTELEQRILNAIDVYGLIESDTPLHVKFLLCIIGLESLLLGKNDRDYLGMKIAEKVTFLLYDVHWWLKEIYNIPISDMDKINQSFVEKHKLESRLKLHKKIQDFYDKRSSLAHEGVRYSKKNITKDDYDWASYFLRWTVETLLNKIGKYTHIAKKNKEDKKYLDLFFQKLKYG